jgi:hypothetical protein
MQAIFGLHKHFLVVALMHVSSNFFHLPDVNTLTPFTMRIPVGQFDDDYFL